MEHDGRREFEWIYGDWLIRHRKLKNVPDPTCQEWIEFDGRSTVRPALDGLGHVDFLTCDEHPDGGRLEALTLRLFNPATSNWTIYWTSSRLPGELDVPVVGRFEGSHGVFEAEDRIGGVQTLVRYEWWHDNPEEPEWQQSFSQDRGQSWRPNWQMFLRRPLSPVPGETANAGAGLGAA